MLAPSNLPRFRLIEHSIPLNMQYLFDLKSSQKSHVVTEGIGSEPLSAEYSSLFLRGVSRKCEWFIVGQCAGDGQDRIQALEHYGTQHHLAKVWIYGEISQMVTEVGQVLTRVHGLYILQGSTERHFYKKYFT